MRNIKTTLLKSSNTALLFAAASGLLYLTACSSDVNYNNPGIEVSEGNVTIGNNPNDQAGRITFYGTPGTRADEDALKGVFPEVGKTLPQIPSNLDYCRSFSEAQGKGSYRVPDTNWGSNQLYVDGEVFIEGKVTGNLQLISGKGTVYIMEDGELDLSNNELQIESTVTLKSYRDLKVGKDFKVYGTFLTNYNLTVGGTMYASGTAVANEITVESDLKLEGDNGRVKAKCITVNKKDNQRAVYLDGNAILAVRSYLVCEGMYVCGNAKVYLWPNAMVEVLNTTSMSTNTCGFYYYTTDDRKRGEDYHALLKTVKFHVEGSADNPAYIGGLFQKELKIKYNELSNCQPAFVNGFVASANAYYIPSDNNNGNGCNPGNGKPGNKYFDEIAVVKGPEHDHNHLSATCIQAVNGRAYVSYHLNEAYKDNADEWVPTSKHMGCVEVFNVTEEDAQITSWLMNQDFDFNHLIVDENTVYTTGDTKQAGATLGVIKLNENGNFGQFEMDTEGRGDVMTYYNLYQKTEGNQGSSGNCIVRDGDSFRIASYKGFQSFNVNDLTVQTDFISTTGSAKHIAKSANYIATLNLDQKGSDTSTATVTVYNPWGTLVNSFKTHEVITPINGKNVIAIDGDVIYVALGQNGVGKYSITTGDKLGAYSWIAEKLESLGEDETYNGKPLANGLCVDEKYVYVANGGAGLIVLDKNTMKRVARHSRTTADTEYSANYVQKVGDLIYIAYGRNGLEIVKLVE